MGQTMRRHGFALLVTAALICTTLAQAQDAQPTGDAANGKRIYLTDGCALCHGTLGQGGRGTGPHIAPNPLPFEAFAGQVRRPANAMPPYTTVVLSDRDLLTTPPLPDPKAAAILDH
jgi:ubiquinol-cytochrome c reductase cytochrome c subunit